jgi:predicted DNA-binding protein
MTDLTTTLEISLSADNAERLRLKAERLQVDVSDLAREVLEEYLDDLDEDDDFEDTPDEKILEDFRQAWHEAMTGQTIPAREAMETILNAQLDKHAQG